MALFGSNKDIEIIVSLIDETKKSLQNIENNMAGLRDTAEDTGGAMSNRVAGGFLKAELAMAALNATVNVARKGFDLLTDSLVKGADLERLEVATYTLGENMGYTRGQIDNMVEGLEDINTYGSQAFGVIRTFIQTETTDLLADMNKDFSDFVEVAKDFAAGAGVSSGDAIDNLTTALQRLQPESLEQFFTMRNLNLVYQEQADRLGKNVAELTEVEKRQAFLNEIFKEGEKVAGTYFDTYETAGKNLLSIPDILDSLNETLGRELQPILKALTGPTVQFLKGFRDFAKDSPAFQSGIEKVAKAISLILSPLEKIDKEKVFEAFNRGAQFIADVMGPAVDELASSLRAFLDEEGKDLLLAIKVVGKAVAFFVGTYLMNMIRGFAELIKIVSKVIKWHANMHKSIREAFNGIKDAFNGAKNTMTSWYNSVRSMLPRVRAGFNLLSTFITSRIDRIRNAVTALANIGTTVGNIIKTKIKTVLNNLIDSINRGLEFNFTVPNDVPIFGGKSIGINPPDIPYLAKGGEFITNGPQLFVAGDNPGGKEKVKVTPLDKATTEGNITININGYNKDPMSLAREIERLLARRQRATNLGLNVGI